MNLLKNNVGKIDRIVRIVLGVLLIASAWVWTRLKPLPPSEDPDQEPASGGPDQPAEDAASRA